MGKHRETERVFLHGRSLRAVQGQTNSAPLSTHFTKTYLQFTE